MPPRSAAPQLQDARAIASGKRSTAAEPGSSIPPMLQRAAVARHRHTGENAVANLVAARRRYRIGGCAGRVHQRQDARAERGTSLSPVFLATLGEVTLLRRGLVLTRACCLAGAGRLTGACWAAGSRPEQQTQHEPRALCQPSRHPSLHAIPRDTGEVASNLGAVRAAVGR
jgi:hypothetical protein